MHNTDFPGTNAKFGPPVGMTDEECYTIDAMIVKGATPAESFVMTAWKPNKEDMEALEAGRPLFIRTMGTGFVPISLFTLDEAGNGNFD